MALVDKTGFWGLLDEEECKGDRKTRKPLVEKKRRARINESLQELRGLLTDTELHAKMENAEVLELTVKRVENMLNNHSQEDDGTSRESNERFAAGYIQCMHEVHDFVSTCPGIETTVAAELLNHLLECMPLNEDLQDGVFDFGTDVLSPTGTWSRGDTPSPTLASPSASSPNSSIGEDLLSDHEESLNECNSVPVEEEKHSAPIQYSTTMWRPW